MKESDRWATLTTAPDQMSAEMLIETLREAGIAARIAPGDVQSFLGVSNRPCRVLVERSQRDAAERTLRDAGAWPG